MEEDEFSNRNRKIAEEAEMLNSSAFLYSTLGFHWRKIVNLILRQPFLGRLHRQDMIYLGVSMWLKGGWLLINVRDGETCSPNSLW